MRRWMCTENSKQFRTQQKPTKQPESSNGSYTAHQRIGVVEAISVLLSDLYLHCEKSYLWIPAVYNNSLWLKCTEKLRFGGETESAEAKLGNLPSVNSLWICFCIWRSEYSYPTTQIQLQLYGKPRIEMLLTSVLISFFLKGCLAAIVKLLVHSACLQSSLV